MENKLTVARDSGGGGAVSLIGKHLMVKERSVSSTRWWIQAYTCTRVKKLYETKQKH